MLAGDVVTTKERSTGKVGGATGDVIVGTGTANGLNIVAHNTLSLSFELRADVKVILNQWGIPTDGTDAVPSLLVATAYASANGIRDVEGDGTKTYTFKTPFNLIGSGFTNLDIDWKDAILIDDVQGTQPTSPFRPNHWAQTAGL